MADYIKREDVQRLICSECCIGFCQKNMCRIINRLNEEIPASDVVEVVRCKDCKHSRDGWCFNPNTYDDCKTRGNTTQDWFCADGERRTEDG